MNEIPWGMSCRFNLPVPRFASGNKRDMVVNRSTGRWFPKPNLDAQNYRKHLQAGLQEFIQNLKDPGAPRFPIDAHEVRLDLYFGFAADEDGSYRRMKLSDIDNLFKITQDALQGIVIGKDNRISEIHGAKVMMPPDVRTDWLWLLISRSGYRSAAQMELFLKAGGAGALWPWRPGDEKARGEEGSAIAAPQKKIITIDEFRRQQCASQKKH